MIFRQLESLACPHLFGRLLLLPITEPKIYFSGIGSRKRGGFLALPASHCVFFPPPTAFSIVLSPMPDLFYVIRFSPSLRL